MTCEDCRNQATCELNGASDEHVAAKMYNASFWETAEETCMRFEQKES